jgi:hypothetical protein
MTNIYSRKKKANKAILNFSKYFSGEIFVDAKLDFLNLFGCHKAGLIELLSFRTMIASIHALYDAHVKNDSEMTDDLAKSVTIVFSKKHGIIYSKREEWFGDMPNLADIDHALLEVIKEE